MRTMSTNMTIQDFLAAMDRGEITVNRHYQRSDQVWPDAARSYLIETVLLDFPIPKLSLHQLTDPRTGTSHKELVDGQQRSMALQGFFKNDFSLSSAVENTAWRGKAFSDLELDERTVFRNYQLSLDLFLGAENSQIREVFRRMNSYTVPLNPEEQRHARFQGTFKWFLHSVALRWNDGLEAMGVFSEKQIVRMADVKLLAEVCHALLNGISTTNKTALDGLYRGNDDSFPQQSDIDARLSQALDLLLQMPEIHETSLVKPFQVYALILAISHAQRPIESLQHAVAVDSAMQIDVTVAVPRLLRLLQAVDDDVQTGRYARFVKASSEKTNVKAEREVRFKYFTEALRGA